MLVDTDFLLALLKPTDWLKGPAMTLRERHGGHLRSTEANLVELLLVVERFHIDPLAAVAQAHRIAPFENVDVAMMAARNRSVHGLTAVDAVLAAHAEQRGEPIVSSDRAFDLLGLKRVPLR